MPAAGVDPHCPCPNGAALLLELPNSSQQGGNLTAQLLDLGLDVGEAGWSGMMAGSRLVHTNQPLHMPRTRPGLLRAPIPRNATGVRTRHRRRRRMRCHGLPEEATEVASQVPLSKFAADEQLLTLNQDAL